MKLIVSIVSAIVLLAAFASIVLADSPEPWTYAAQKCSGLSHVEVLSASKDYADQYGVDHALPFGDSPEINAIWNAAHPAIVNGFLSSVGCPAAINDDGTALTFWFKIYTPVYRRYLDRNFPQ